jgi:hypothetical protein
MSPRNRVSPSRVTDPLLAGPGGLWIGSPPMVKAGISRLTTVDGDDAMSRARLWAMGCG